MDAFRPRELEDIADLMRKIELFNKNQHGAAPIWADVVISRNGKEVAAIGDALVFDSTAGRGEMRFEAKP